jgi:two-component system cell cycle response regulator
MRGWLRAMGSTLSIEKVEAIFAAHNKANAEKKFDLKISDEDSEEVRFLKSELAKFEEENLMLKGELANCRDEKERLENMAMDNVDTAEEIYFTREALNKANEELHTLSITDALTGAYNRRFIMDNLSLLDQKPKAHYALLMLDIDHFKKVNDTYGHEAGDIALVAFSDLCKKQLPENTVFGRLGGEEFAVILRKVSLNEAVDIAENLRKAVAHMTLSDRDQSFTITVSIGAAECKNGNTSSLEMLRLTDDALYKAKDNGRNRIVKAQ